MPEIDEQAWLAGVKAGDTAILRGHCGERSVVTISRTTPCYVFVRMNERCERAYRRKNGRQLTGDPWSRTRLIYPDRTSLALIENRRIRGEAARIIKAGLDAGLPTAVLVSIADTVKANMPKAEGQK
jgi:hypothetical protein